MIGRSWLRRSRMPVRGPSSNPVRLHSRLPSRLPGGLGVDVEADVAGLHLQAQQVQVDLVELEVEDGAGVEPRQVDGDDCGDGARCRRRG